MLVSCQKDIEVSGLERVAILLFDWNGITWDVSEIVATNVNEEVASPHVAGNPVIFQADDTDYLEIALRTRPGSEGIPHLYAWRYDSIISEWIDYSNDFPVVLSGCFYGSPTAVDFDGDNYEELIVTTYGSGDIGTALKIIDFENSEVVDISTHELTQLNQYGGNNARAFGTIAVSEEDGVFYLAGAATNSDFPNCKEEMVFVYSIATNPVTVNHEWDTQWMHGEVVTDELTGPSIGDISGDSDQEVIFTLNATDLTNLEGVVYVWNLVSGALESQSFNIPYNPIIGGGQSIKSQPVVGLNTSQGSSAMTIFTGFSSYCYGFDLSSGNEMIEGFPSSTREASWAAPAICDLDGDDVPEILYIDISGYASLFDWNEGCYTEEGWHMYQDNPHRNGFYNYDGFDTHRGLDIRLSGSYLAPGTRTDGVSYKVIAELEITGISAILPEATTQQVIPGAGDETTLSISSIIRDDFSSMAEDNSISGVLSRNSRSEYSTAPSELLPIAISFETVEIAVFCDDRLIGSEAVPLESGSQRIEIPVRLGSYSQEEDFRVVADPYNDFIEIDESNNSSTTENTALVGNMPELVIPSPAEVIELTLNLPNCITHGLAIRVYSIEGRLVTRFDTEDIQAGRTTLLPGGERELPSGMYTVCIEGLDVGELVRKVIILND